MTPLSRSRQAQNVHTNTGHVDGLSRRRHVALLIEMPSIYTDDLEGLREFRDHFETESDWLLNCIASDGGPVRVRCEISGEKDSDVVEIWGYIREAQLVEPSRGYGPGPIITEEQLAENGFRLMPDEDESVKASTRLRGKLKYKLNGLGRNMFGLVCADCGATWLPDSVYADHKHVGDDWKGCPGHYIEVTGVD